MNCKKAEKFLLLSLDGRLNAKDGAFLKSHLAACAFCRKKEMDYRKILGLLQLSHVPEPLPHFEQRLLARLRQSQKAAPAFLWRKWATRAAAVSLVAAVFFGVGVLSFRPNEFPELSQAEILLLRNENPLAEAATILDQQRLEDRNLMLIFAASEIRAPARR
ncbi:MAG: hypothetical protein FJY81_00205 [Candidatus Aminicenantes bacterium]|nr:hypothetical protein [Candidatus Aminicenantes bacterium]